MAAVKNPKAGPGRPLGVPNKATAEIKDIARQYGPAAVQKLAELAGLVKGKQAAIESGARIAAVKELLDRGYGKSTNIIAGDNEGSALTINLVKFDDGVD